MAKGQSVGYIRVSTIDQNTERQLDGIELDRVFTDRASGKDVMRPQLQAALQYLREGDKLVVHSLDRLARNAEDLLRIVRELTSLVQPASSSDDGGGPVNLVFLGRALSRTESAAEHVPLLRNQGPTNLKAFIVLTVAVAALTVGLQASSATYLASVQLGAMASALTGVAQPATAATNSTACPYCSPSAVQARETQLAFLRRLLWNKRYDELDKYFDNLQHDYEAGKIPDYELLWPYRAFRVTHPGYEPLFTEWKSRFPKSYAARVGAGTYFREVGYAARGSGFAKAAPHFLLHGLGSEV